MTGLQDARQITVVSMNVNTPNLRLALAASYNERGILGFTNTVTNAIDQRKINSIYQPIVNAVTGGTTLYLAKRPGVDDSGQTYGATGQVGYLVHHAPAVYGSGTNVWLFSTSGNDQRASSTATTTVIAAIAGTNPAYVDRVAISNADTVVVQLRTGATGVQRVFYSTAIATWTEITDTDFTGLSHRGKMEFMDGFAFMADNTAKSVYNSDLNSLSAWSADSYIAKQIVQDEVQGLARLNRQIICFGSETAEVFFNAGNDVASPLGRAPEKFARIGLDSQIVAGYTHYYATLGGRIYFVGRDASAISLGAYAYDGERFEKVSSPAIDAILSEHSGSNYSVNKVVFSGQEGIAFALDATTAATQRWLVFFPAWKDWFEWQSTVFTPVNNGEWFLGTGTNQHTLKRLSRATSNWQDDGTNFTWTHQFKLPSKGNDRKFMSMFGVIGDTARSASSLNVQFSDDDWQTLTTARVIDMTTPDKAIYRCGSYMGRGVRLTHTANLDVRLEAVVARVMQ